jgi:hypothetical protein
MSATSKFSREARRLGVQVIPRSEWGSKHQGLYQERRKTKPHSLIPDRPVDTLWQHITVTFDDGVLTGDFKADMREVERIGFERFGTGFSYNLAIDFRTGMVGIGQPCDARGAHTLNEKGVPGYQFNQNYVSLAIAFIGMPGNKVSKKAEEKLVDTIVALILSGNLTTHFDYNPHSMVAAKECPTQNVRNIMVRVERKAKEKAKKILKERASRR